MTEKELKAKDILLKLTELENKKPTLVEYLKGVIDGIILSNNIESDKK